MREAEGVRCGGLGGEGISFIPTQQCLRVNWAAASFCGALSL